MNNLKLAQRFLLISTPLVAGSVSALLNIGITALPSLAATLASSQASFKLDNFSHNPSNDLSFTNKNTYAIANSGQVTALANAQANFINNLSQVPSANNLSFSIASGKGSNYFGLAQSQAGVFGYNFFIGRGETFSFNFDAFFSLNTSLDTLQSESVIANVKLDFNLYDSTDKNNLILLDSFTISDSIINLATVSLNQASGNITLTESINRSLDSTQDFVSDSIQGQLSRSFASPTYLTLEESVVNETSVEAVPEPSNVLAILFSFAWLGFGYKRLKIY